MNENLIGNSVSGGRREHITDNIVRDYFKKALFS